MDVTIIDDCVVNQSPNFEVSCCASLGRYMVATRDIKRGEIILQEQPIISGPIRSTELLCPGCYQTPEANVSTPNELFSLIRGIMIQSESSVKLISFISY